jgi:hypothetical protein
LQPPTVAPSPMTSRASGSFPNWPVPQAVAVAFAWSPAVDAAIETIRVARVTAGLRGLVMALVVVAIRYGIARYAFLARGRGAVSVRLAALTFALGVSLRLVWLLPLSVSITPAPLAALFSNSIFVPAASALYAATLPALLLPRPGRGSANQTASAGYQTVVAALWVALPQIVICHGGFWEADWKAAFLGIEWKVRLALGVLSPFAVAVAAQARTWKALGLRGDGVTAAQAGAWAAWMGAPLGLVVLSFAALFPASYAPDPCLVTSAGAADGTQLLIAQIPDDPTDVFLNVRHPGGRWIRFRIAYGDALWAGRIDFAPSGRTASISAYDVLVARFDLDTDRLEKVAPLTGFVGNGWSVAEPIRDPLTYNPVRVAGAMTRAVIPKTRDAIDGGVEPRPCPEPR